MQPRFVVRPDGESGQHIVKVGLGTSRAQYAPAMVSGSTSYRSPDQGEAVQSQVPHPHLQSEGSTQIDNGETITRSQRWPQAKPSESGHHHIEPDPAGWRAEAVSTQLIDQTEKFESMAAHSIALEVAHSPEVECMVDHTLADLDAAAQWGWYWFRNAQLYALLACVPLLRFAEAHEREFRAYCVKMFPQNDATMTAIDPARASIESLVFTLQIRHDPEARKMKRAHRAECANAIGWFAHLCDETDRNEAVKLARSLGRVAGIASIYRKQKDEQDPSRQERAVKAKAARNAQHMSQSAVPPSSVPLSPVGAVTTEGPAATIGSLSAVATAVALASSALNSAGHHEVTQLLAYLKEKVGIRPLVNSSVSVPDQMIVVLLQVGDTILGPICDQSICTAAVAQLVTEHLQQELPQDGLTTIKTV